MHALTTLAELPAQLAPARSQMAFTLGFHIILASLGVGFPALMLIANYIGLKRNDEVALGLAQRWSKVAAVTFAVGAVTGTVLSFEFGLLWPEFTGRFGDVFGILFGIEGIFFFLEAIFIAIYIFGWKHLSGWKHFWTGVPIAICGIGGAFSVVAVNSWMNQPRGFTMDASGNVTDIDPLKVIFNNAVPYEVPHMILAAYLVTGFLVASVYAVGMLKGRRDRHHRLGLLIPLTLGCILAPIQFAVGDTAARAIAEGPAGQVRGDGVRADDIHATSPSTSTAAAPTTGSRAASAFPASIRSWSASAPTLRSPASTRCRRRTARRRTRCSTGPSTRWSESDLP